MVKVEVGLVGRTLTVGDTMRLTASPKTVEGHILGGVAVDWLSEDPAVASVSPRGLSSVVLAKQPGTVRIRATAEGRAGEVFVTVIAAPLVVASVEMTPGLAGIEVGQQMRLDAIVRASDGTVVGGRVVQWTSSDPTIATVTAPADGAYMFLNAHRAGQVTITAAVEGKTAQRVIIVAPGTMLVGTVELQPDSLQLTVGQQVELTARVRSTNGFEVSVPVTWRSSDSGKCLISVANGAATATVTAQRGGRVTITAEAGGVIARAVITVQAPVNVTHVMVSSRAIWVGQVHKFEATVLSSGGTPTVTWSVEDPSIAEVDSTGRVRGLKPGTTRVRAESGGKSGTGTVEVFAVLTGETELTFSPGEDMHGQIRLLTEVGRTTWTDHNLVEHAAIKYVVAAKLKLFTNGGSGYEHTVQIHTVLANGQFDVVATEALVDRGQLERDVLTADKYYLVSTDTPGKLTNAQFFQAGRLVVFQKIGTAPLLDYVYRLN